MDNLENFIASEGARETPIQNTDNLERFIAQGGIQEIEKPKAKVASILDASNLDTKPLSEVSLNQASSFGSSVVGGWRGLATLASGGTLDDAANAVREEQQNRTYEPESKGGQKAVEALSSPYNPLNWIGMGNKKAGELAQDYLKASPAVATAIETGLTGAESILPFVGKGKRAPVTIDHPAVVETTSKLPQGVNYDVPTILRRQAVKEPVPSGETAAPQERPVAAVKPPISPPEAVLVATADEKLASDTPITPKEKEARINVLKRIGLEKVSNSVINANPLERATDYQVSRYNEPAGEAAKAQLDSEKQALNSHAEKIVSDTGGTAGMDQDALHTRGTNIAGAFDSLRDVMDKARKNLYAEADKRAGGVPNVQMGEFGKLLDTDSVFAGKAENGSLRNGVQSYLKEQNILNKDGSLNPVTPKQAEGIRQYINSQWSPETSGLAGKIKGALDKDVLSSAGEDIYSQARNLFAKRKQTLDNPNGIAKLMDADSQTPINRSVPFEKIPDYITRLPKDQFQSVIETLKNMPEELQPQAQKALAEIKAHMASKLQDAGAKTQVQWDAPGVSKILKENSAKYNLAFSPEELAKIKDLNDAGHILRFDPSYPGASAQAANVLKRGVMSSVIRPAAAWLGGAVGGPIGAGIGDLVGARGAVKLGEKSALSKFQKNMVPLKDVAK